MRRHRRAGYQYRQRLEISIGEMAEIIGEVMGAEIEFESDPETPRSAASEVERLSAGVDKARAQFGWALEFGGREGFRRGLEITAAWF